MSMNVNSSTGSVPLSYLNNSYFLGLSPTAQQDYISTYTTEQLNTIFPVSTPVLAQPANGDSAAFFTATSGATNQFEQTLDATDVALQGLQGQVNIAAAIAALGIAQEIAVIQAKIAQAQAEAQTDINTLQQTANNASTEGNQQESAVTTVNSQDSNDKTAYANLNTAQNNLVAYIQSIGGTQNSNGTYTIPSNQTTNYNNYLTNTYDPAVSTYNTYMNNRLNSGSNSINSYNNAANAYNTNDAGPNNATMSNLITKYNLSSYLTANNINLTQPTATVLDTTPYGSVSDQPPASGTTVTVNDLPSYVATYAANGPPVAADTSYTAPNSQTFSNIQAQAIKNVTSVLTSSLTATLNSNLSYIAFLTALSNHPQILNTTPDPILNHKAIAQKIIPDAIKTQAAPVQTPATEGASGIASQAIGLGNSHLQGILGDALLKQAINNLDLNLTSTQTTALVSQLQTFLVGQVGATSIKALFQALAPIESSINSLPPNSAVLGILFSVSFANRVQEAANGGITASALSTFIQGIPALQNLTPAQQGQLAAALNTGLLLVSLKLIESNLGLNGLSAQILLPLLTPGQAQTTLTQALQNNNVSQQNLETLLQNQFISQGYTAAEANFLANFGTELSQQGLLTPSPPVVSSDTVNTQVLTDSVAAGLLLANQTSQEDANSQVVGAQEAGSQITQQVVASLDQANQIAAAAVQQALSENEINNAVVSADTFKGQLASALHANGIGTTLAQQIANEIVLIPPQGSPLQNIPSTPPATNNPSGGAPINTLSQGDLFALVQQRVIQLVAPQLGFQLSQQVTQSISTSLFGTPNPDASDKDQVKKPFSVVNSIASQITTLHKDQDTQHTQAVVDAFSSTIQNSTDLYTFLTRAMDPAFNFIYSANAGIMYSRPTMQTGVSKSFNQSIDIQA